MVRGGVLVSILVVAAVGCGNASTEQSVATAVDQAQTTSSAAATPITELTTTTVAATIHEEGPLRKIDTGDSEMAAEWLGQLAIVGGCVQQGDGPQGTVVLWPLDVHWDDTTQQVVFPGGRRLALGTDVALGGGEISIDDIKTYWPDGQSAAEALAKCHPDLSYVWVAGHQFGTFRAFDLDTTCGIYGTMIDGVWWAAREPLGGDNGGPPAGWTDPQTGTMTIHGDDLAVFETDQGLLARFVPTTFTEPQATCP